MIVDPLRAAAKREYGGHTYFFCATGCAVKFDADPERYLHPERVQAPAPAAPANIEYTCPMHPEIRQIGPGACPKCGMALEPAEFSFESALEEKNPEYADMKRRFAIALMLTAPVLVLGMISTDAVWSVWVQFGLATPVVFWAGWP